MKNIIFIIALFIISNLQAQNYEAYFSQGVKNLTEKNYTEAINNFRKAISQEPDNKNNEYAFSNMAYAQEQSNDPQGAIESYGRALAYNPVSINSLQQRAKLYMLTEQPDSALLDYNRILTEEPGNTQALFFRAYIHGTRGNYTEARSDYNRLLAIEPDHSRARLSLALLYQKEGRINECLMLLEIMIEETPNAELYFARSNIESDSQQYELAIMDIEKAIELAPDTYEYHLAHAQLLQKAGKTEKANEALLRAEKLHGRILQTENSGQKRK